MFNFSFVLSFQRFYRRLSSAIYQVLLVAFGTIYFGDSVSFLNGLGIIIVIIGSFK